MNSGIYILLWSKLDFSFEALRRNRGHFRERRAPVPHLEEVMTKRNLHPQIAIAAAAFVAGIALAPVSAFAQARNVNDGGQVSVPAGAKLDSGSKPTASSAYYGRSINDGGMAPEPAAAQVKAATAKPSKAAAQPAPTHLGRNVDDGGSIDQ
jgi:hypothetical protein